MSGNGNWTGSTLLTHEEEVQFRVQNPRINLGEINGKNSQVVRNYNDIVYRYVQDPRLLASSGDSGRRAHLGSVFDQFDADMAVKHKDLVLAYFTNDPEYKKDEVPLRMTRKDFQIFQEFDAKSKVQPFKLGTWENVSFCRGLQAFKQVTQTLGGFSSVPTFWEFFSQDKLLGTFLPAHPTSPDKPAVSADTQTLPKKKQRRV